MVTPPNIDQFTDQLNLIAQPTGRCSIHRRDFLRAAIATSMGVAGLSQVIHQGASAQTANHIAPGNKAVHEIHELRGTVNVNGKKITVADPIKPGDTVMTANDGYVRFVIGNDAFFLRERSQLMIAPAQTSNLLVGTLRLITGALGSVWGKRERRSIQLATATIGIRGTGVYAEARGDGVYACTCYGETELTSLLEADVREQIVSGNHTPRWISNDVQAPMRFKPAPFETHTNEEMDILEKCVGRRAPWFR